MALVTLRQQVPALSAGGTAGRKAGCAPERRHPRWFVSLARGGGNSRPLCSSFGKVGCLQGSQVLKPYLSWQSWASGPVPCCRCMNNRGMVGSQPRARAGIQELGARSRGSVVSLPQCLGKIWASTSGPASRVLVTSPV